MVAIILIALLFLFLASQERYQKYRLAFLYVSALALLFQNTLASAYLTGTDSHIEYYYSTIALGGWDYSIPYPQNASGSITLFPRLLLDLFGIPVLVTYKVVFPLLFALLIPLAYLLFKRWVKEQEAFLGAFFLLAVPTFFMEVSGIIREQLAEVLFVVVFLLLTSKLAGFQKVIWGWLTVIGIILTHYSIYAVAVEILLVAVFAGLFLQKKLLWVPLVLLLATLPLSYVYYSRVVSGEVLASMQAFLPGKQSSPIAPGVTGTVGSQRDSFIEPSAPEQKEAPPTPTTPRGAVFPRFENHEPIIKTALGLDFFSTSLEGKVFRVFQFLTQAFLLLGVMAIFLRKPTYLPFALGPVLLLGLALLIPGFSAVLNATRFYHVALLILGPAIALGYRLVFKNLKLLPALLVLYFLFTSGFVFEALREPAIDTLTIPYSVGLSGERLDLGFAFTPADEFLREHIYSEKLEPIYADFYGTLFLQERLGPVWRIYQFPLNPSDALGSYYLYLRSGGHITYWGGVGLRKQFTRAEKDFSGGSQLLLKYGEAEIRRMK